MDKQFLWESLIKSGGFSQNISVDTTKSIFEETISETETLDLSIEDKNDRFLSLFSKNIRIHVDLKTREKECEDRILSIQSTCEQPYNPRAELSEIKELLYLVLEKINAL